MNYNRVILLGRLTKDPQLSYLPSNTPVVEIDLAVNHTWTKDGQKKESVCYISCRAYGKQAEVLNQYMRKGRPLLIEGRLEQDTWEAQDGTKRSKHRVFIERFTFVDGQKEEKKPEPNVPADIDGVVGGGEDIPFSLILLLTTGAFLASVLA